MLLQDFTDSLILGLEKKSMSSCSIWTKKCRVMSEHSKGTSFKYHPWTEYIHDLATPKKLDEMQIESNEYGIQKAAQMGLTETLIDIALYTLCELRKDVLYVLPTKTPDVTDFSTGRLDTAIALSPYLQAAFSSIRNVNLKKAGNANMYIRGASTHLKSLPVSNVFLDEVDEFPEVTVPRVRERLSGQFRKTIWAASTPTIPDHGINIIYESGTQHKYIFKCPYCSKHTYLDFNECLVVTAEDHKDPNIFNSHLICNECKHILPHETKPEWLSTDNANWYPSFPDRHVKSFYINQLYSMTEPPVNIAINKVKALSDPVEEQEYYNNKGALPHVVADARITDDIIKESIAAYKNGDRLYKANNLTTLGIDIGGYIHFSVCRYTIPPDARPFEFSYTATKHIVSMGKIKAASKDSARFNEIVELINVFKPNRVVIDAQPEKRAALDLARRFPGLIYVCYYDTGSNGKKDIHVDHPNLAVTVDRTIFLDRVYGRFRNGKVTIPLDTPQEFFSHMKALVRVTRKDKYGNHVASYQKGREQDHYAHSLNYNEVALAMFSYTSNESERN